MENPQKDPFEEYLKETEPGKRDRGYAWHTAIGLQAVDGLIPSDYLKETAKKNIEGDISLDQAQMRIFVDTLYGVVQASETDNLIDFTSHWFQSLQKIGRAIGGVDEETAKVVMQIMRALFDMVSLHARQQARSRRGSRRRKRPSRKSKWEMQREKFEEGMAQLESRLRR